ncbi:DoxX family protein [bacterium]|nr:DoxX family protein [bacterium]
MQTDNDCTITIARVMLGLVMFPHGAQKMLGWCGGHGFSNTMNMFTQGMGVPALFAFLAIVAEFFGSIGLIVGLFSRIAAAGIASVMLVATLMVHRSNGFFMNWMGNQKGEGYEYHILAIALCIVIMCKGSGSYSLDPIVAKKLKLKK